MSSTQRRDDRGDYEPAREQTFSFRRTHPLPASLPAPAEAWRTPYEAMAREDQLARVTLEDVTKAARTFLEPVLVGGLDATWSPSRCYDMGAHMKTTVEIASPLLREAKREAQHAGVTLRELIETGLRRVLDERKAMHAKPFKLRDARNRQAVLQPGIRAGDWAQLRDLAYGLDVMEPAEGPRPGRRR